MWITVSHVLRQRISRILDIRLATYRPEQRNTQTSQKNTKSHVCSHILSCDGCKDARVNFTNFEVLKHYSSEMDCKVGEALAIKKHRPHINKQLFANGASLILNVWN